MSNVWKSRERETRWDPVITAALEHPYRTRHVAGVLDDEREARDAAAGIYAARRHFKVSVKSGVEPSPDGKKFTVWFILFDPADAKKYIAAKVAAGEPLAYNVLRSR